MRFTWFFIYRRHFRPCNNINRIFFLFLFRTHFVLPPFFSFFILGFTYLFLFWLLSLARRPGEILLTRSVWLQRGHTQEGLTYTTSISGEAVNRERRKTIEMRRWRRYGADRMENNEIKCASQISANLFLPFFFIVFLNTKGIKRRENPNWTDNCCWTCAPK